MSHSIIVGNWKMYGLRVQSIALVSSLADYIAKNTPPCDVILCPPATLLSTVYDTLKKTNSTITVGGQDCHEVRHGPYTGDISPRSLREFGSTHVIVGHSERRRYHHEDSDFVARKARRALEYELIPIICIGESLQEREAGSTHDVIEQQFAESVPEEATADNCIIAYEPVWAIGTGDNASPEQIADVHTHIKSLSTSLKGFTKPARVIYGGSVKGNNARELLGAKHVDGALVGSASLHSDEFASIIQIAGMLA